MTSQILLSVCMHLICAYTCALRGLTTKMRFCGYICKASPCRFTESMDPGNANVQCGEKEVWYTLYSSYIICTHTCILTWAAYYRYISHSLHRYHNVYTVPSSVVSISCWSRSEFRIFVRRFVPSPYVYKRRQEELALWKRLNKRKCKSQQTAFEDGECVNNSPWCWQLAVVIPKSAFSRRSRRPNTLQSATHTFGGTRWRDKHQSAYQQIFFFQINFLLSHHINFLSVA